MMQNNIHPTGSMITPENRWDHFLARVGVKRMAHLVEPGLYALGKANPGSPVFVSANYTLSFDALRSALADVDCYIMVLDTKGVNVWCAAGERTFGTDEIVRRIEATGLGDIVKHRVLIVPQLGAPGIAAHEVKKRSGFKVEYGPVRATDLPAYLTGHEATPEMRRVRFGLADRLVLVPVEIGGAMAPALIAAALGFIAGGWLAAAAVLTAAVAAVVLFPMLLPWLPTRYFTVKGLILGLVVLLPFAVAVYNANPQSTWWLRLGRPLTLLLALPPLVAYLALLFTGSTTFTSRTGVRHEIFTFIRPLAVMLVCGLVLALVLGVATVAGGWR
jgi:hypothetical protein